MNRLRIFKKLIALSMSVVLFSGCGDKAVQTENLTEIITVKDTKTKESMLDEAQILYEVSKTYPHIVTDISGYDANSDKVAILYGENLPAEFSVIDAKTGETVYKSFVKRRVTQIEDEYITATADFSDLSKEGDYYIDTEILGRSKVFSIKNDWYASMLKDAYIGLEALRCTDCHIEYVPFENDLEKFIDTSGGYHISLSGEKDVVEGCLLVMDLCTAYEYYPKAFTDDNGIEFSQNKIADLLDIVMYEARWLMKMQNPDTGGVYTSVSYQEVTGEKEKKLVVGGETTRATAYYCACMAKLSVIFSKVDAKFSKEALATAGKSWNCLEANKDIVTSDQMYRAAVEMYRATGYSVYNQVILNYLKVNADSTYDGRVSLDAAITYLATPRATDVSYCTKLMSTLMSRTEAKVSLANTCRYSVESTELTTDDMLRNAFEMIVVDYILQNREYERVELDYLHYLSGRNETSTNYIEKIDTPDTYAKLIAVLGKLSIRKK